MVKAKNEAAAVPADDAKPASDAPPAVAVADGPSGPELGGAGDVSPPSDEAAVAQDAEAKARAAQARQEKNQAAAEAKAKKAADDLAKRAAKEIDRARIDYEALVAAPTPVEPLAAIGENDLVELRLADGTTFLPGFDVLIEPGQATLAADGTATVTVDIVVPADVPAMTASEAVLIVERDGGAGAAVFVSSAGGLPVGGGRIARIPANSLALRPINAAAEPAQG